MSLYGECVYAFLYDILKVWLRRPPQHGYNMNNLTVYDRVEGRLHIILCCTYYILYQINTNNWNTQKPSL